MPEKEISVKYHADIERLTKIENGDWVDLRAAEDTFCPYMEQVLVNLGVSMRLPEGYEAHLAPRSSTFKHYGIIQTNSVGVIDNSYSGNNDIWRMPVICLIPHDSKEGAFPGSSFPGSWIRKGDRIAQFRIMKRQPSVSFAETDDLGGKDRGGFGSTGTK